MLFILLSAIASAQQVETTSLHGGAEFRLTYADGETVTAHFYGGVFGTADAERAIGLLGDHLFEHMDVFRNGGGDSFIDVDLGGEGGGVLDDTPAADIADPSGGGCSVTTSVGDVLVSFGAALPSEDRADDRGDDRGGIRAKTGGLAEGDEGGASDYATGGDITFDEGSRDDANDGSVDAVFNEIMNDLFGDGSSRSTDLNAHELTHVVQQKSGLRDTGWEGTTWEGPDDFELCLPINEAESNINWNILGDSMFVQPDPTRSEELVVEGDDVAPINLIGEALEFRASAAYLRDDSAWDTDPSPRD